MVNGSGVVDRGRCVVSGSRMRSRGMVSRSRMRSRGMVCRGSMRSGSMVCRSGKGSGVCLVVRLARVGDVGNVAAIAIDVIVHLCIYMPMLYYIIINGAVITVRVSD
jgi:hypothetical protein